MPIRAGLILSQDLAVMVGYLQGDFFTLQITDMAELHRINIKDNLHNYYK